MGKNLQQQESAISLEHSTPGCMKGIFHHFNHHKWHYVRKRLPYRRHHHGGKNAAVVEDPGNNFNTADAREGQAKLETETAKSSIQAKSSDSGSGHKRNMKSRIKALITEEVYKRKGRHHRSSSYPTRMQLERTPSIHHLDVSSLDPCAETASSNETLDQQDNMHSFVVSLLDPLLPKVCGESVANNRTCELCAAMVTKTYLRQSELNEYGKQPVKDHTLLQDKLVYAIEPSKIASVQESKLFLDALDLLNIRKELFLKVLQDPNSSLAHQLHCPKASSLRSGLTKSVSFPMPGSSGRILPASESTKSKNECGSFIVGGNNPQISSEEINSTSSTSAEELDSNSAKKTLKCADDEAPKQLLLRPDPQDSASICSTLEFKNQNKNKLIIKRFKNLREKIRHAIKESRKERQRIVMDAVLHKIPYGYQKDMEEEADMQKDVNAQRWNKCNPGSSFGSDQSSTFGKIGANGIRRTSSFNESINKYNQLLELCSNREANSHTSGRSTLRKVGTPSPVSGSPVLLGRIRSLPDLRSYSFSRIEGLPAKNYLETPIQPTGTNGSDEQKPIASENQIQLDVSSEIDSRGNILEVVDPSNDLGGSKRRESMTDHKDNIESEIDAVHDSNYEEDAIATGPAMFSTATDSELAPEELINCEEDCVSNVQHELSVDSPGLHENHVNIDSVETSRKQSYNDLLHLQVDMKNKAEFNYVRDVLELSGFSGSEFLGKWHSEEQPVDPLVFEGVEGCLLAQPDCSGNEVGGSCNHLLLFDLINEVLLEIYERKFSYWPRPLTCCSHVHPMPVGYHVLEDVWANINWYLRRRPEVDQSLDDAVNRDLSKNDGWMNIQFEAECVGLELEELIFDDLLEELVFA